jgi:hypothetical protein
MISQKVAKSNSLKDHEGYEVHEFEIIIYFLPLRVLSHRSW